MPLISLFCNSKGACFTLYLYSYLSFPIFSKSVSEVLVVIPLQSAVLLPPFSLSPFCLYLHHPSLLSTPANVHFTPFPSVLPSFCHFLLLFNIFILDPSQVTIPKSPFEGLWLPSGISHSVWTRRRTGESPLFLSMPLTLMDLPARNYYCRKNPDQVLQYGAHFEHKQYN